MICRNSSAESGTVTFYYIGKEGAACVSMGIFGGCFSYADAGFVSRTYFLKKVIVKLRRLL